MNSIIRVLGEINKPRSLSEEATHDCNKASSALESVRAGPVSSPTKRPATFRLDFPNGQPARLSSRKCRMAGRARLPSEANAATQEAIIAAVQIVGENQGPDGPLTCFSPVPSVSAPPLRLLGYDSIMSQLKFLADTFVFPYTRRLLWFFLLLQTRRLQGSSLCIRLEVLSWLVWRVPGWCGASRASVTCPWLV